LHVSGASYHPLDAPTFPLTRLVSARSLRHECATMRIDATLNRLRRATELAHATASSDFDLNSDEGRAAPQDLRDASVLIPFVKRDDRWNIVLTKRTSMLRHHPGQIAFPGGKRDKSDTSPEATALREAHEEIGLNPQEVKIIGTLGQHESPH